jgi:hypothetical protein
MIQRVFSQSVLEVLNAWPRVQGRVVFGAVLTNSGASSTAG